MPFENTPMGQLVGLVPDENEAPDVSEHLSDLAAAIERQLVLWGATLAALNALSGVTNGMFGYAQDEGAFYGRRGGQWVRIFPPYSGTSAPASNFGYPGDVYYELES